MMRFLILLLAADLLFIILYLPHAYWTQLPPEYVKIRAIFRYGVWSLKKDFGYAEVFQYIKEFWNILLLLLLAARRKGLIYFFWSILFLYLLLDDSGKIHEGLGLYISQQWGFEPAFNLRAKDFGEALVSAIAGSFFFILIGVSYLFSNIQAKLFSRVLFFLIIGLAVFGVGVDMVHRMLEYHGPVWAIIEDGGEMVMMSIITWYVFIQGPERKESVQ